MIRDRDSLPIKMEKETKKRKTGTACIIYAIVLWCNDVCR